MDGIYQNAQSASNLTQILRFYAFFDAMWRKKYLLRHAFMCAACVNTPKQYNNIESWDSYSPYI